MIEEIILSESQRESELLRDAIASKEKISKWKERSKEILSDCNPNTNFFLAETYFHRELLNSESNIGILVEHCQRDESSDILNIVAGVKMHRVELVADFDSKSDWIRFRFISMCYPFDFVEQILSSMCVRNSVGPVFTNYVNANKKGYAEKHIEPSRRNSVSSAYWGMKRRATLPMQLWAYDLSQCDPELETQTYSRRVFPIFSSEHMEEYMRRGIVCREADYQFFLDGMYSYIDLARSWNEVKELEAEWEELNAFVGTKCSKKGDGE